MLQQKFRSTIKSAQSTSKYRKHFSLDPGTPRDGKECTNDDLMGSNKKRIKSAARTMTPMADYQEFKN